MATIGLIRPSSAAHFKERPTLFFARRQSPSERIGASRRRRRRARSAVSLAEERLKGAGMSLGISNLGFEVEGSRERFGISKFRFCSSLSSCQAPYCDHANFRVSAARVNEVGMKWRNQRFGRAKFGVASSQKPYQLSPFVGAKFRIPAADGAERRRYQLSPFDGEEFRLSGADGGEQKLYHLPPFDGENFKIPAADIGEEKPYQFSPFDGAKLKLYTADGGEQKPYQLSPFDCAKFRLFAADGGEQGELPKPKAKETIPSKRKTVSNKRKTVSNKGKTTSNKRKTTSNKPSHERARRSPRGLKPSKSIFSNLREQWTSFKGPREKGDVRDVVLMSLSFAVLIYISQHLVHTYMQLRHMYH